MVKELRQALLFTLVTMVLLGGAYHVALWGIGRTLFAAQAEGSLIRRDDGTIIGSRLIAQKFERPEYFRPRPSGVGAPRDDAFQILVEGHSIPPSRSSERPRHDQTVGRDHSAFDR